MVGLIKYHAVTLLMRTYEYWVEKSYDPFTLDKLTKDTFGASKTVSSKETDKMEVAKEMFHTGQRPSSPSSLPAMQKSFKWSKEWKHSENIKCCFDQKRRGQ